MATSKTSRSRLPVCQGRNGGTVATLQNRILGFHDYGVEAVTDYVDTGGIERSALQWRDAILEELEV